MSQPPSRPYQGYRYQTDDPYDEYPGRGEPVGAGYRPPEQRRPDAHNGYGPSYDADGQNHPYGGRYDPEPAYGGPNNYERAYDGRYDDRRAYGDPYGQQPAYGGYGYGPDPAYGHQEPAYGSYDDPRYQAYGQPPAQPHRGYRHPAGPAYPTAVYRRVNPPVLDDRAAAPPSRRSRRILVALAVVLLLVVGAGTAFVLLRTDLGIEDTRPARLTTPDTLAGRPKITDGKLQELAAELVATIKRNVPEATDTVGAFYGNPAKKDMIMVAGASGPVSDPGGQLDRAMHEMATGGLAIRDVTKADPGPLGGVAKCGDATADGVPLGVCAWSDRGSLVLVVLYYTDARQAAAGLAGIRAAIEQRG